MEKRFYNNNDVNYTIVVIEVFTNLKVLPAKTWQQK